MVRPGFRPKDLGLRDGALSSMALQLQQRAEERYEQEPESVWPLKVHAGATSAVLATCGGGAGEVGVVAAGLR